MKNFGVIQEQSPGGVLYKSCSQAKARKFIKKESLAQVFSCEFYEIFKNTFLTEQLLWLLLVVEINV